MAPMNRSIGFKSLAARARSGFVDVLGHQRKRAVTSSLRYPDAALKVLFSRLLLSEVASCRGVSVSERGVEFFDRVVVSCEDALLIVIHMGSILCLP
jgi:hypothetical protein